MKSKRNQVFRKKHAVFPFVLLLFCLLFPTCTHVQKPKESLSQTLQLSIEEKNSLMEFFRDLLLYHGGAYTLYGTKPVTIALLQQSPSEEEETEWWSYYLSLPDEEKNKIQFYKPRYDFLANYKKWNEIKQRIPMRRYLFGKFRLNDKAETICFVNIEMTLRILLDSYEDFRRGLGYDFDPFQAVFEVEDPNSIFWNKIIKQHALLGIILGFGQDNAWFFRWRMYYEDAQDKKGNFVRSLCSEFSQNDDIIYPDPQHFMLPLFRRFGLCRNDLLLIDQYKKEQQQIKSLYKNRDEVDVALEWLTK